MVRQKSSKEWFPIIYNVYILPLNMAMFPRLSKYELKPEHAKKNEKCVKYLAGS